MSGQALVNGFAALRENCSYDMLGEIPEPWMKIVVITMSVTGGMDFIPAKALPDHLASPKCFPGQTVLVFC